MEFSTNAPVLFVLAGIIIAAVLAQSVFFLVKAWRRAREIGMDMGRMKKTARTAAIFTIAPAVAIVISIITLSKDLGAATNAESAMGLVFGQVSSLTARQYVTIAWVMTISILVGIWLVPLISRRILNGMISMENRDRKWAEIFSNALFIGMIAAFLGYVFSDVSTVFRGSAAGLIPVCVMLVSAVVMVLAGLASRRSKKRWISDYALPVSLVVGMIAAIPITAWLS